MAPSASMQTLLVPGVCVLLLSLALPAWVQWYCERLLRLGHHCHTLYTSFKYIVS